MRWVARWDKDAFPNELPPSIVQGVNSEIIRDRINATPAPFVFRLSEGTCVPVVHPDFVAVSPGQIFVIGPYEFVTRIDPLHVVAIEEMPPKKGLNGKWGGELEELLRYIRPVDLPHRRQSRPD